jgi:RimJ/RimL family protein N-acetyltransferase
MESMELFSFEFQPESKIIHPLRLKYLDELPHAQEYYLELQIQKAHFCLIKFQKETAGYFVLSEEGSLLEYYVLPEWINQVDTIFGEIIRKYSVRKALCKSFDAFLLSCCYGFQKSSRAIGILFREYSEKPHTIPGSRISIQRAVPADEAKIIAVNEEVFDHPSEVLQYILANQIFLYANDNDLVGFGIYSQVIPGRPDRDIGMLVVPAYRKKGYGQFILNHLVRFCNENGWQVSAGCAIENIASRKCLEKAGFIARYRLLEFVF